MAEKATICPHCEAAGGELASPCANPVCDKNGYHFIPVEHYHGSRERMPRGAGGLDPEIGRLVNNYLLVEKIGEGGMGVVYLALQLPLRRHVALKMIPGVQLKEDDRKRFEREAMTISILYHPNIVSLFEYGFCGDTGAPFMVLEYVKGRDLADLTAEKRKSGEAWDRETLTAIFTQVLNGLGVAHKSGLVHRDIKPQNIMLVSVEGNPCFVKILDFGLVRALVEIPGVEVITSQGELWGTPEYMAPEQLSDMGMVDHRCDLYALGVILLEMLTGHAVFRRKSLNEIFALKLDDGFDPVRSLPPGTLTPAFEAFFRKALRPSPKDRFSSAQEMRDALLGAMGGRKESGAAQEAPARAAQEDDIGSMKTVKQEAGAGEDKTPASAAPPAVHGEEAGDVRSIPVPDPDTTEMTAGVRPYRLWLKPVLGLAAVLVLGIVLAVWVYSLRHSDGSGENLVTIGVPVLDADGGEIATEGLESMAGSDAAAGAGAQEAMGLLIDAKDGYDEAPDADMTMEAAAVDATRPRSRKSPAK